MPPAPPLARSSSLSKAEHTLQKSMRKLTSLLEVVGDDEKTGRAKEKEKETLSRPHDEEARNDWVAAGLTNSSAALAGGKGHVTIEEEHHEREDDDEAVEKGRRGRRHSMKEVDAEVMEADWKMHHLREVEVHVKNGDVWAGRTSSFDREEEEAARREEEKRKEEEEKKRVAAAAAAAAERGEGGGGEEVDGGSGDEDAGSLDIMAPMEETDWSTVEGPIERHLERKMTGLSIKLPVQKSLGSTALEVELEEVLNETQIALQMCIHS
jgi:hypothetical protein